MRLNVLRRWWPRPDEPTRDFGVTNPCAYTVSPGPVPEVVVEHCPPAVAKAPVSNSVLQERPATATAPQKTKPRARRKQYKVGCLMEREPLTQAQIQAAALLEIVALKYPDKVGKFITHTELKNFYVDVAVLNDWDAQRWTRIAQALHEWTLSKRITRKGKKTTRYKLPRVTRAMQRRASLL